MYFIVQDKDPSSDQERIKFKARKQSLYQFDCWLDRIRFSISSSTSSSIDQDCDIIKNLKHEKYYNFLVSSPICD